MRTKTYLLASALSCALALALHDEALAAPPVETKAEADALTDKAAALYDEGVSLYKRSRWAEARASFLAAWSLKQHWQIAGNLADCELKLERHREAAEHAGYYKRHAPADRQGRVEGLLKAATAKVATVTVTVEPAGAEVLVDGEAVGRAPLEGPVYLDPGEHKIGARVPGRPEASEAVAAAAGGALEVRLAVPEAQPAARIATKVVPREQPAVTQEATPSRSMAIVVAGASVAVVGLGLGVGFTVAANGKSSDADGLRAPGGDSACLGQPRPASCDALKETMRDVDTLTDVAVGSYVLGGVAAVATAAYVLWPRAKTAQRTGLRWAPWAGPGGAGWIMGGSF